jgi:hypothetical protein
MHASFASEVWKRDGGAQEAGLANLPSPASRVAFVYFDAGGGHRSAMKALCAVSSERKRSWDVTCVNLQELLDPLDLARKLTGVRSQDVYNLLLRKGWTLGAARLLPLLHAAIRGYHAEILSILEPYWQRMRPDLVISLVPHFNRQLAESLRSAIPGARFVTLLTDFADYPPHFWIEPESQYLICGTKHAVEQALSMGHSPHRVFLTSGMVLDPVFYTESCGDRFQERKLLGLDPDRLTGLVMFGGQGSRVMLAIARRLSRCDRLQLIFIAGRNASLENALRKVRFRIPVHIVGFTSQVYRYMQLSDFFIGKPGPGSITEALHMGLPVIVQRNAWTLPQEGFNTEWVTKRECGIVVGGFREIYKAVGLFMQPAALARYQTNARALRNRAVFEIPEILDRILSEKEGEARGYATLEHLNPRPQNVPFPQIQTQHG